ncbi:MAG: HD domain-containing protein [Candidatus Levyibacteriota bacterium]
MNRDPAYLLLTKYLKNKNLIKHSLATEATMRALYRHLTTKDDQTPQDEEKWGITGLLHDVDYEVAQESNQLDKHGMLLFENGEVALPLDIEYAIRSHNYTMTKAEPQSLMDWSITACDQLTGLITACALVRPDKKLDSVTEESVLKKFGQKAFAAGADRNAIRFCESKLNIPLDKFVAITLKAMQSISNDLGL